MEIYLTRKNNTRGYEHDAGKIYEYDDDYGRYLLHEGYGVKVDFPKLQNYKSEIDRLVAEYRKERDEIKTTDRYRDNEAEREFQLSKLKLDLGAAVQEKKDNFLVDAEVLYRENAAKVFDVKIDNSASEFVNAVKTQFAVGENKNDLTDMLVARLRSATAEEKTALALSLKDIGIPADKLSRVENELKGAAPGSDAMMNCTILQVYKETQNPAVAYDQLKVVETNGYKGI